MYALNSWSKEAGKKEERYGNPFAELFFQWKRERIVCFNKNPLWKENRSNSKLVKNLSIWRSIESLLFCGQQVFLSALQINQDTQTILDSEKKSCKICNGYFYSLTPFCSNVWVLMVTRLEWWMDVKKCSYLIAFAWICAPSVTSRKQLV